MQWHNRLLKKNYYPKLPPQIYHCSVVYGIVLIMTASFYYSMCRNAGNGSFASLPWQPCGTVPVQTVLMVTVTNDTTITTMTMEPSLKPPVCVLFYLEIKNHNVNKIRWGWVWCGVCGVCVCGVFVVCVWDEWCVWCMCVVYVECVWCVGRVV